MSIDFINKEDNNESNNINKDQNLRQTDDNDNSESQSIAEAFIEEKQLKTIVSETKFKDQLRNKGFGEVFNEEYLLSNLETLYLLSNSKLKLRGKKKSTIFHSSSNYY